MNSTLPIKKKTYEFYSISALDTLNLKLDVSLFSIVQGEVVLVNETPPLLSFTGRQLFPTHTHTLSLHKSAPTSNVRRFRARES